MTILESPIKSQVQKVHMLKAGPVYIFKDFMATEFKEGATVDYNCFMELYRLLDAYSTPKKPFGLISNRIHSYAINTIDFMRAHAISGKHYPCAVVTQTEKGRTVSDYLKKLLNCDSQVFKDLDKAKDWLLQQGPKASTC